MPIVRIALPLLGLAALGAGLVATTGMAPPAETPKFKLDGKTEAALDTLHDEIQRRFHDRNDVDFGFGRVVRPNSRLHRAPPLMEKLVMRSSPDSRTVKDPATPAGLRYEVKNEELGWVDPQTLLPEMTPETDAERMAIATLRQANADVAIYTFGLLGNGKVPVRAKGPGYIRQKTAIGPKAEDLVAYAQRAWRGNAAEAILEGPNGWQLRCYRVVADHESCVNCHAPSATALNGRVPSSDPASERNAKDAPAAKGYAVGDPIGLLVIAVHPRRGGTL